MNIALWIVQGLLAFAFGYSGIMKIVQSKDQLKTMMHWVVDARPQTIKGIGILEVLAAIGLILPQATGVLTWLTPLAAAGLILLMLGAIATHTRRHETHMIIANLVLLVLAAFVAIGRFAGLN